LELPNLHEIGKATHFGRSEISRLGIAVLFLIGVVTYAWMHHADVPGGFMLIAAAVIGGYMALNIGANDVANNVGPAVGARALTLTGAIIVAGIFEASGALLAGGEVVNTIKKGIINPEVIPSTEEFIWLMLAALLAAGAWLNIATALGAPVSTTHSIVGGVLGAGIAAGGWGIASWDTVGMIAASWVISPLLGGAVAAIFLYLIKRTITYQGDMLGAATRMVPKLLALMAWAFATYIALKGMKQLVKFNFIEAAGIGIIIASVTYAATRPRIFRAVQGLENTKAGVNSLFTIPLIFSAALLSFAHGANDVANAVGPLAAINDAVLSGGISAKASIPLWVMVIGGAGIAIGLALYGPKLIRTVGTEITDLDQSRAFCVAMAASLTVILATQLGLPVSSTHIAVGAVFGVGFMREHLKSAYSKRIEKIRAHHTGEEEAVVEAFLADFESASIDEKGNILRQLKRKEEEAGLTKDDRKRLRKVYKKDLVKRSAVLKIIAAWLITVPASGFGAAMLFFTIRGMMLP
jgi:inorganic phosphate transporter, PiT family